MRRALIFGTVSLALMLSSIDQTIVATALPEIQRDLGTTIQWSTWTITIYALGQVLVMPMAGKLADAIGRRRVFIIAATVFSIATIACIFATDITMLIVLRACQAIGGGAFMPSASGIVAELFGRNRDRALGMFTTIFPIGGIAGPVLGGLIVGLAGWRDIFLVTAPIAVVIVILAVIVLPRSRPVRSSTVDVPGILLLIPVILGAMLGVTSLGDAGGDLLGWCFIVPEAVAFACLGLFVARMRLARSPLVPPRLLWGPGFGVINLINLLWGGVAIGATSLIPLYAQDRFDIPPLESGTLLSARAVGMVCISALATFALRRTGYRLPMIGGFLLLAAGMTGLALVPDGVSDYLWLFLAAGIGGIGIGIAVPSSNNAAMQLAPEDAAAIAGLRGMFRQSGSILAISVTSAVAARSSDAGGVLATTFLVLAGLLLCIIPLVLRVPEHRGSW